MFRIYAHRGDSAHYPENTRAAFESAVKAGADGIETDLRLTRDGRIVLNHDRNLCRFGGDPTLICNLNCFDLKQRLRERGITLVTLDAFWEAFAGRIRLNLEVKEAEVFTPLRAFLRSHTAEGLLVTSSQWAHLAALKRALPFVQIGPVVESFTDAKAALASEEPYDVVSMDRNAYDTALNFLGRERGRRLLLWTVNDPTDAIYLAGQGVDGIFTNDPGGVLSGMRRLGAQSRSSEKQEEG